MKLLAILILGLVCAWVHIWSVVLSIQVNGFSSAWGIIAASVTFVLPLISELAWGLWAYKHSHPFLFGALVFWAIIGIAQFAQMCVSTKGKNAADKY
jgi:hypothetical protein